MIKRNSKKPVKAHRARSAVKRRLVPRWIPGVSAVTMLVLLCLTINFRAWSDHARETEEHQRLNDEIKKAMIENIALQEQIHYLKNDSDTVEKEVKKFGLVRSEKMNSKPAK